MNEALTRLLPMVRPYDIDAVCFRVREINGMLSWRLLSRVPARAFIDYVEVAANDET